MSGPRMSNMGQINGSSLTMRDKYLHIMIPDIPIYNNQSTLNMKILSNIFLNHGQKLKQIGVPALQYIIKIKKIIICKIFVLLT
ncbi:hypothetical protein GWI33_016291 [Rhynchophorus ferrugineus]|uniref:Uncharacterized protein n=1 Tax=Rhynchophorus ferrugineus TaxID=354439 RepID=A0A834I219_RHYFE|nr:hypothetical protein GWI33_016291 [Rhynchophorus ferrugineus]